ncbi:fibronectin type III domain-containing protein [uncultured Desulfuromusa sp.]|uniref:fibronectin type III domain-containing protein n=1 Tax=uncultured Desulfuromusa sp. TaxID=219183 RepID=UPI002AA74A9A|nr:fibronectin type III domain-containing protein [uncultured Desulfuromusa sp.]
MKLMSPGHPRSSVGNNASPFASPLGPNPEDQISINRHSNNGQYYGFNAQIDESSAISTQTATSAVIGKLRLTRSGTTVKGYAWIDELWVHIGSWNYGTAPDAVIYLGSESSDNYPLWYDNFRVNSGDYLIDGIGPQGGSWLNTTTWQGRYNFTGQSGDGEYTVTVSGASDIAGNSMTSQEVGSFVLDTVIPESPVVTGSIPAATRLTILPLSGSGEVGSQIVINNVVRATIDDSGNWSCLYSLKEGDNSLTLLARDAAGNDSAVVTMPVVVLDTTPPAFSLNPYPSVSAEQILLLSGTIEAGATLKLDGVEISDQDNDGDDTTWAYSLTLQGTGLQETYQLSADDALENSSTRTIKVTYDAAAPVALPDGALQADGNGNGQQVHLSWLYDEPLDLAYYRIYQSTGEITDLTGLSAIGTVNRGTKSFVVNSLSSATSYTFAVEPVDSTGNSIQTPVHSATATPVDVEAPEEISSLGATVTWLGTGNNQISLSWQPSLNSLGDLADQILYLDSGSGYDAGTALGAEVTSYQQSGLADQQSLKYKIATVDSGGHQSSGVSIRVATALDNPQSLSAVPGKNKVSLSWQPISSSDLLFYKIYRQTGTETITDVTALSALNSATATSYVDNNLSNGTTYQYAVTAVNRFGAEKPLVNSVAATPRQDETGPEISGPQIAEGSVSLQENHVLTKPLTLIATASDSESPVGQVTLYIDTVEVAGGSGSISYFWNLVETSDGTHSIKVEALDAVGNLSTQTRTVQVSLAAPSSAAADLRITTPVDNARPTTATIPVSGVAPQFTTLSLKVNDSIVDSVAVGSAGTFSFSAVPLSSGSNQLKIMAAHRGGESAWSYPLQVIYDTGAPAAPTDLSAQALAGGKLQFTWQTGSGETPIGYNLYGANENFDTIGTLTPLNETTPIPYLFKEYQPADDGTRYYAVTAVDASGNESPLSERVQIASDRTPPTLFGDPAFIIANRGTDGSAGPGQVEVELVVTEELAEQPFFSLEPGNGSPIIINLNADADGLTYRGSFQISALSPHGPTSYNFSTKDAVGNRGHQTGTGLSLDSRGPQVTITGLAALQEATGTLEISVSCDEEPSAAPTLTLHDSTGNQAPVTLSPVDSRTWGGSLSLDGLEAGYAAFQLGTVLVDELGNSNMEITSGGSTQLYVGTPPAPQAPTQLTATTRSGGEISLVWQGVAQVSGYRLYRRISGDSDWQQVGSDQSSSTNHYDDLPPSDGIYDYVVTALGVLSSESERSPIASAQSDRTPPPIPDGLSLTLDGNGVLAGWNAAVGAYGYRLYQSAAGEKGNRVAETLSLQAIDPAPVNNPQAYVVTAVDTLGNESDFAAPQQIAFAVAPPAGLNVKQSEGGMPELTWSGSGDGYYIYRNGSRINSSPTTVTSYTDIYYSGEAVTYGISMIDANQNESPVRELTLPQLQIGLADGTTLRRGILERIPVVLQSDSAITVDEIQLQVAQQSASTLAGPYILNAGEELSVDKIAVAELNSPDSIGVLCTAVLTPHAGSRIEISQTAVAAVSGAGSSLEIYSEPLVRGTGADVRIKINNQGSARMDLVTSRNGGVSDQIRILLKDEDGNLLGQTRLNQRSGSQVFDTAGYATARIEAGESFVTNPISIPVPELAPYKVYLEAQIDQSYYHYGQDDQVTAPGLQQKQVATIADVSYRPNLQVERVANAQGDKVFGQGETVRFTGTVTATSDNSPMANVPVRIGISVDGFDRFYSVSSDSDGSFSYDFKPGENEIGHYSVWSSHPDLSNRNIEDSFDIIAMRLSPTRFSLKLARGGSYNIPVKLTNLSGATLTNLSFVPTVSSGLSVDTSQLPVNGSPLEGHQSLSFELKVSADSQAPSTGTAILKISNDEGLNRSLSVNVSCYDKIPIIATSPSYIEAGLVRDTQQIKTFAMSNSGLAPLVNTKVSAPSLPWIKLVVDPDLGQVAVGESRTIGLLIQPPETLTPDIYTDQVVISADNHIPYTYNISVMVSSDAVGSLLFDVVDELTDNNGNYRDVVGANITLQNQAQPQLIYTLKTTDQGTAVKNDIPEGRYSYTISATGHKGYSGTITVVPGLTVSVPIALEVTLVEVEWSVTEVTIEDRYEIVIKQTFETNVPTSVLVVEPPGVNIPDIQPGEVYNGEFTITNYGLVEARYKGSRVPASIDDYDIELLGTLPEVLSANQRVTVPYRITRRVETEE